MYYFQIDFFFSFSIIPLEFIQVEIGINNISFFLMLSSILLREWNMVYSFLHSWKDIGFFPATNKPTELFGTLKLL